jgi:hypothetical protein
MLFFIISIIGWKNNDSLDLFSGIAKKKAFRLLFFSCPGQIVMENLILKS